MNPKKKHLLIISVSLTAVNDVEIHSSSFSHPSLVQVQSLCKMDGETKRARWPPLVTQAGKMMKKEVECGTAQAPREVFHRGGREAMGGGIRAMLGRNPATRWVTGVKRFGDLKQCLLTQS